MLKLASEAAKAKGQTVGKWLEEAISEKICTSVTWELLTLLLTVTMQVLTAN